MMGRLKDLFSCDMMDDYYTTVTEAKHDESGMDE